VPSDPILLRPAASAYLGRVLTAPPTTYVVVAALVFGALVSGLIGSVTLWSGLIIALVIEVVRVGRSVAREQVEYGGGAYRVRRRDGRWTSFAADQVGQLVVVRTAAPRGGSSAPSRLYLSSRDTGERLLRLSATLWRKEDLAAFADDLRSRGVSVEDLSERAALEVLKKRHPWALDRWESNLTAISIVVALLFIGALTIERFLS
jgi:hypothetical protein